MNNQVFNHKFMIPNQAGIFPAGWRVCRQGERSQIFWNNEQQDNISVVICNHPDNLHYSSICQEKHHYIQIHPREEWEFGAVLHADRNMEAMIKVHFLNSYGHMSCIEKMFTIGTSSCYFYGKIKIPEDVQWAYLEIGTNEIGILWIQEAFFKIENSHCHHKINIGHVDTVRKIIEPVKIERCICNTMQDVIASHDMQFTEAQNVFLLDSFTFSVINQGSVPALIHMQSSPDGIHFMDEPSFEELIEPTQMKLLTSNYALPYVRIKFRTEAGITNLRIFLQGHD